MNTQSKFALLISLSSLIFSSAAADTTPSYRQVATGQVKTYNNDGVEVTNVKEGDPLYGQDAHYSKGAPMAFKDNGDGTITDLNTGLTWQKEPPTKGFTWQEAHDYCESLELGGHSDWRLPTAKELFSISDFSQGWPYVNPEFFKLVNNERVGKDEQYWTSNKYLGNIARGGHNGAFGVNHATGHIKTYSAGGGQGGGQGRGGEGRPQGGGPQGDHVGGPQGQGGRPQGGPQGQGQGNPPDFQTMLATYDKDKDGKLSEEEYKAAQAARPQRGQGGPRGEGGQGGGPRGEGGQGGPRGEGGQGATRRNPAAKQVRAVRGTPYGVNNFVDNGDGTITDKATGLMWAKEDSQKGMDWQSALQYAENSQLAGHSDWRLPNVKELQGIVNYDRAPNSSDPSKEGPAIDPMFQCSDFVNAAGVKDYPYFWTSTSALFRKGSPHYYAWYVAFGRAVNPTGQDSHGAGGVRFDTKHKDGPAGEDAGRVFNHVRIVRDSK